VSLAIAAAPLVAASTAWAQADPLPSWNESASKRAILDFIARTTAEGGGDVVPVAERIAVFDNDGTLWTEQPIYFQFAFAIDRVKAMAPQHPEWKTLDPFKSVLAGDMAGLAATGEKGMLEIVAATHSGMTSRHSPRRSRTGSPPHAIHASTAPTPSWSFSRCSS
jgi:hypothetical protein